MLITRNPTSVTTPDPGQGGNAVTGAINTGHGSTLVNANVGTPFQIKTCLWTGFQSVSGNVVSINFKADWSEDGFASPPDSDNDFRLEYSLNGGGAWNTAFSHTDVVNPASGSVNISIPRTQDLTQFRVRDLLDAQYNGIGANLTGSISNIRLEVTIADPQLVVMM